MIRILLSLIFLFLLFSCHNDNNQDIRENNIQYYIVQRPDTNKIRGDQNTSETIVFRDFYAPYNIIFIDSLNEIYYHKERFHCINGYPQNNVLPFFAFLKKEYFEKCTSLNEIENKILNDSTIDFRWVYLISNKDTILDPRYFKIKNELIKSNFKISTRLLTEEEESIMTSVLKNDDYNPEKIIWHKTLMVPDKELMMDIFYNNVP